MNNFSDLLCEIAEVEFACIDINLFLDTHPNCERALADYNCYGEHLRALKAMYDEQCGPCENFGNSPCMGSWKWNEQAWPWDKMEG